MMSEALAAPATMGPLNVYQRCASAPLAAPLAKVNQPSCASPCAEPLTAGNTSSAKPCPSVVGSYQRPVGPYWSRSTAVVVVASRSSPSEMVATKPVEPSVGLVSASNRLVLLA